MSLTMLDLKYQGQESSRDRNEKTFKETWIGDEASIDAKIASVSVNTFYQGKGYLRSWRKSQDEGPHYQLELEYGESYGQNNTYNDDVVTGQKSAQLSTRTLQMPLETAPNYFTRWNYNLASKDGLEAPDWWESATDLYIPAQDINNYMWFKSPTELDVQNGWGLCDGCEMQMPGIEYYDLSYFVVTVQASYRSASAAGSDLATNINTVTQSFAYDFGLGGQWKLDDAQVYYSGKSWIASNTWTRAADKWDGRLYAGGTGGSENND